MSERVERWAERFVAAIAADGDFATNDIAPVVALVAAVEEYVDLSDAIDSDCVGGSIEAWVRLRTALRAVLGET